MYYGLINSMNRVAPSNPLWNNLLVYWTGDNTPNDAKGTKNLTLINGATYGTGKINNGFSFDGVNDYASYTGSIGITSDFSLSLWVKPSVLSGTKPCLQSLNFRTLASGSLDLYFNGTNVLYQMCSSSGTFFNQQSTTSLSASNWYHIVISYDNTAKKADMYINGSLDSSSQTTTFNSCSGADLNNGIDIGVRQTSNFYTGIQDEIAIFDSVLTSTQVTELYNSGSGKQYPL